MFTFISINTLLEHSLENYLPLPILPVSILKHARLQTPKSRHLCIIIMIL